MKFIADANLLSEPTKLEPAPQVVEWLRLNEGHLAVTPVILGELEFGILLLPLGKRKKGLQLWFEKIRSTALCLDFDSAAATAWAQLLAKLRSRGLSMPIKDSLIAASAIAHNLALATRNTSDFKNAGIPLINPFETN
ncbi:MAG: PIN domain-containing protein [Spartobacteria bacterium]